MGRLVFCDIEGTLVEGSIAKDFVRAGRQLKLFPARRLVLAQGYTLCARLAPRYGAALRWRALLQLLAGQRRADVERAGRAGMAALRPRLKPATLARLTAHKAAGDTVVLLSGGLHDAARVIAEAVGADAGEGTQPELRNDTYTGRLRGAMNAGPGKARRAAHLARQHGVPLAECVAYGDSGADIPLLTAVGHPVAVDPDPQLQTVARARGWEILRSPAR
ncbi:MAG TPA: HAD-IB family hydrolase [Chloroflexia bacterium]|nr:HAD-IB family hydrolase [Chloroflexia bacterium]